MLQTYKIKKIASIIGAFFLFLTLNPFIIWISYPPFINISLLFLVVITTLTLNSCGLIEITKVKLSIAFLILLFMIQISTPLFGGASFDLGKLMHFSGLLLIIFFSPQLHLEIFMMFRKLMIFFAVSSVIVFLTTFVRIELPYYKIPGFSLVMTRSFPGSFYKLYGVVVTASHSENIIGGFKIARSCGPFLEGGHYAIYLGIIMFLEKILFNKVTKVFIVASIFTFSPTVLFFLGLIFIYDVLFIQKGKKLLPYSIAGLLFIGFIISVSGELGNQIYYILIESKLESAESNSLNAILNDRAGKDALDAYESFKNTSDVYFGKGLHELEDLGVLSDYRGLIYVYGYIGFFLCLFASLYLSINVIKNNHLRIFFILSVILIISHRSWMMNSIFIYAIFIIASTSKKYLNNNI
jgi:hypothetical protein